MNNLSVNFSIALLCILIVFTMLGTIFNGQANTLAKYTVAVLATAAGLIVFGAASAEIVNIIKTS